MKIKKGFVLRMVGGENIVVPIGEQSKRFHGMITLNDSGAFLWTFFSEEHTAEEAVEALFEKYDATKEELRADVEEFISLLRKKEFCE